MSYVWSSGVTVTVSSGPTLVQPSYVRITSISPTKTTPNSPVSISIEVGFPRALPSDEDLDVVIAVNNKSNIVHHYTEHASVNYTRITRTLSISFSNPGTYIIYVGARATKAYSL